MEVASPEKYPSLKNRFTEKLNYDGDVVKSCIHCHQIGDAQRAFYWDANKPIPEKVLFPYPHPTVVGLVMDPHETAVVSDVKRNSAAAAAGINAGDAIKEMDGQPLLSVADLQWVLHNIDPDGGQVPVKIQRGSELLDLTLRVPGKWRQAGDISWRVTSWGLRRIAAGGMNLVTLPDEDRRKHKIADGSMALLVRSAGKYGAHATARKLGIREGDVILGFDGHSNLMTEQALHTYVVTSRKPGDQASVKVLRGPKELTFKLPIQP